MVEVCKQKHEMVAVNGVQYRKDNFDFNVDNNPKQIIVPPQPVIDDDF